MRKLSVASIQNAIGLGGLLVIGWATIRLAMAVASFSPATQPTGWVAQGDLSNYNLTSGNETLYRTEYEREFWSGNLHAFPVSATGQVSDAADRWTGGAADTMDLQHWDTGRLIATMTDTGSKVPFRAASLSATQQAALSLTLATTTWTATQVVNYLRGDRTNEGLNLPQMRYRKHVLGDIIHSRPYYVDDATNPTVFVESNDGMLHAFNGADGTERWAYVPSMLIPKLKTYANNPYTHDYFADGQINIGTVSVAGTPKRILVGGLGAGGKGLFALNIDGSTGLTATTETDVANKILWEIQRDATGGKRNYAADANYNNLGYTYSTPAIVQVPTSQDAVIIGNGYNDAGDNQAYLFVINAADGSLIKAIQAGSSGTAASPNGLGSPYPVDSNFDGKADIVYAGDFNGTLWKFDLSSATATSWSATALYTTSPAQPITANVAAARHPQGGYMVTFGTGGLFSSMDMTDTSTYYVYGVWDGAPAANVGMQTQTLEERSFGGSTRVRRASNNSMTGYRGWKVALPAGERVLGEGTFIENGTYFFTSYDPTKTYVPPATTTTEYGENWLMELDYLSGGSGSDNRPIFDMNGDLLLTDADRLTYIATDAIPTGKNVGDPITTTDGIIVGKFQDRGVMSQPLLVQLATLNYTLFNQNPDVFFPTIPVDYGVTGGHFDVDIFYGNPPCGHTTSGGTGATATITVGSTGSTLPATLGGILVDGIEIVPALTQTDLPNGTATATNATTIKNKVGAGFTATVSGNVITVTAPVGAGWNGKSFTFVNGTSQAGSPGVAGVYPTGLITFGPTGGKTSGSGTPQIKNDLAGGASIKVGGIAASTIKLQPGKNKTPAQVVSYIVGQIGTGGTIKAYIGGNAVTPTCAAKTADTLCLVDTSTYGNGSAVTLGTVTNFGTITWVTTPTAGGVTPVPATGWENLAPQLSGTTFSGGTAPTITGYKACQKVKHVHQWDDVYNVTGVNMLAPSDTGFDIKLGIPSTSTPFKVLLQNQYLNPAVKLHIGDATYLYNVDAGYISVKNYQADVSSLDLGNVTTYTRNTIGSLALNMPKDALTAKNWWGNGDVRAGLIPNKYACVWASAGVGDSNLYQPVTPPANGTDGPGVAGSSGNGYAGVRHNGALTLQLIKADTPNTAIELNDPNGRPEYGWRLKKEYYDDYLLVEWSIYWHHPNNICYHNTGWLKAPPQDNGTSTSKTPAAGSSDPKIGDLSGGGGAVTSTVTTVSTDASGNEVIRTVITYANGTTATIVRTHIVAASYVLPSAVTLSDGTTLAAGTVLGQGYTLIQTTDALGHTTTDVVASTQGCTGAGCAGGNQRGDRARTGRVSWHEIVRD